MPPSDLTLGTVRPIHGAQKVPRGKARQQSRKEETQRIAAEQRRQATLEREKRAFFNSPAGLARTAFDEKDHVFQCAFDVMSQEAAIVAMVGSRTTKKASDPTAILNSVCREGWELVTGSFVFVEEDDGVLPLQAM